MSNIKRFYEEHFDELTNYDSLKAEGLTDGEIAEQWSALSVAPWNQFCNRSTKTLEEVLSEN